MKHVFILNPVSGNGKQTKELHSEITKVCLNKKIDYSVHITSAVNDAERFASSLETSEGEVLRVYVCGGDGTVNEVANGLRNKENVELAIIPCGTGNDFVRSFGKHEDFLQIERQIDGKSIAVDLIAYGNRVCVNMCNVGFDSAVASTVNFLRNIPFLSGKLAYINGVIYHFFKMPKARHRLEFDDGEMIEGQFLLTAIGNGCFYGGGFKAASLASPTDGLIDVVAVTGNLSRFKFISLIGDYKKGKLIGSSKATGLLSFKRCKSVKLFPHKESELCVDGEIRPGGAYEFTVLEKALRFVLPSGVDEASK